MIISPSSFSLLRAGPYTSLVIGTTRPFLESSPVEPQHSLDHYSMVIVGTVLTHYSMVIVGTVLTHYSMVIVGTVLTHYSTVKWGPC